MKLRPNLEEFNETSFFCHNAGLIRFARSCSSTISADEYEGTAPTAPAATGPATGFSGQGAGVLPATTAGRRRARCGSGWRDNYDTPARTYLPVERRSIGCLVDQRKSCDSPGADGRSKVEDRKSIRESPPKPVR